MKTIITLLLTTVIVSAAFSQTTMQMTEGSEVSIFGTSNVHDWSEHCEYQSGAITVAKSNNSIQSISDLTFKLDVKAIKSGKSTMDNYTYEALKQEDHPFITFTSNEVSVNPSGNSYSVSAKGKMTIGGQTKIETITATCNFEEAVLKCTGKKAIDMTQYDIEPPSIMFGAMTVGKDVEVDYAIHFK